MTRTPVKGQLLTNRKLLGKRIQERREAAGLTQEALAARLGVDQATVSRWEKGRVPLDTDDLEALGRLLQARAGWFLDGGDPQPLPFVVPARDERSIPPETDRHRPYKPAKRSKRKRA